MDADAAENGTAAVAAQPIPAAAAAVTEDAAAATTTETVAQAVPPDAAVATEDAADKAVGGAAVADAPGSGPAKTANYPVVEKTTDLAVADSSSVAKENGNKEKEKDGGEEDPDKGKSVGAGRLLFQYATWLDILYMFLGTCSAIVCG